MTAPGLPGRAAILVTIAALAAPASARATAAALADSVRYATAIAKANRVGLTVTNYGFFGTNFKNKNPSFEFPLGDGFEHMARAGLWVGGQAVVDTGLFTGVSSAIVDDAQASVTQAESEFTPAGKSLIESSRIENSPAFSKLALSDQDFDCWYSDEPAKPAYNYQQERHTPLDILVHQKTLAFSLPRADAFVVTRFTIINKGGPLLDAYVGLYAQLVSGNKNAYVNFPPSGWYYKTHIEYDDPRRLYKEHYCTSQPYPTGCNFSTCPPWAAVKLLKVSGTPFDSATVSFNWWSYSPGDPERSTDVQRYAILGNGARANTADCIPGGSCSPIMVLSVGPLGHRTGLRHELDYGDSVTVDFAFVGGDDEASLLANADYAQFAADIDYKLPTPPPSPRLAVRCRDHALDLYWDDSPEFTTDSTSQAPGFHDFEGYRVYLGTDRNRLDRVAQFDVPDTSGFNTGLDSLRLTVPFVQGAFTYRNHFAIEGLRDGFSYFGAVTSYDIGDAQTPSLESGVAQNKFLAVPLTTPGAPAGGVTVFPNPYRVEARWDQGRLARDHYLWFANLPPRANLRIYTLSGDLVQEVRFDGSNYRGEGARGLYDPRHTLDTPPPVLSGSSWAWNLISRNGEAVATGIYLFSVEDLASGKVSRGKFVIVKSDREQ